MNWPCIFFSVHLFKVAICLSCLNSFFSCAPSLFKIYVFLTPSINLSLELLIYHARLFSSTFTHISQLMNPLPPFFRGRYNRPTSLLGCNAPCNVIIFLVFLSNSFNSSIVQSTTPALYLKVATAHVLTAMMLFFPLNFVFKTNFKLRLYSIENRSFVSFSFNWSVSRLPRYLYPLALLYYYHYYYYYYCYYYYYYGLYLRIFEERGNKVFIIILLKKNYYYYY